MKGKTSVIIFIRGVLTLMLTAAWGITPLYPQSFDFGESAETGETKTSGIKKGALSLRGTIYLESAIQVDPFRWVRLGPAAHMILESNSFFYLYGEATGRVNFAYEIEKEKFDLISKYALEMVGRELYIQKNSGPFTFTLGKKIVSWSRSDLTPIFDLLTPADMAEAFFANPEEARLGQNVLAVDFFLGKFSANFVFVPFPVFNRTVDGDHPYSLTAGLDIAKEPLSRKPEAGLRLDWKGRRFSSSVLGGWVQNRAAVYQVIFDPTTFDPSLEPLHQGYFFGGLSGELALDPFLLKLEGRYSNQAPFQRLEMLPACAFIGCPVIYAPAGITSDDEVAVSGGFEFNAGQGGFILAEASYTLRKSFYNDPAQGQWMAGAGWNGKFYRDLFSLGVFVFFIEDWQNVMARAQLDFRVSNLSSITFQGTLISIKSGNTDYLLLDNFDRCDLAWKFHFDSAAALQ